METATPTKGEEETVGGEKEAVGSEEGSPRATRTTASSRQAGNGTSPAACVRLALLTATSLPPRAGKPNYKRPS